MEQLESFDFRRHGHHPDWDKVLDGGIYRLTAGTDFGCSIQSFRGSAAKAAKDRNKKVRIQISGSTIVVQAIERPVESETRTPER